MKPKPKRKPARRKAAPRPKRGVRKAKPKAKAKRKQGPANKRAPKRPTASRWVTFVRKHGVVFASATGALPSVAQAVAGEPMVGSWWAHAKGRAIFQALSEIDDSDDVRCFKLVDGKITFVHRRVWPALVRLANDGALGADRVASVQQEHMPTGEHRNFVTPFPDWVDDATAANAEQMSSDEARAMLGAWT